MINKQKDSIRAYLQEIGRIKMLTADEEISLARQIQDLMQLENSLSSLSDRLARTPSDAEWAAFMGISTQQLRSRLYKGRKAKNGMVQANLRLVVSIAKKYFNRGLSFQDLIQEGTLGLIRAAEKFDPSKGYKFSTYATWWVRQSISRAIHEQCRTIRLPGHLWEKLNQIKKTTKILTQKFGRQPTEKEIADACEIKVDKLRFIVKSARAIDSTDRTIGNEVDSTIGDFIAAESEPPEEKLFHSFLFDDLNKVLDTLSPREAEVMRLRYGFDDGNFKTLEKIAQKFNISKERVRQIEARALRKLRHRDRTRILREYIV